MTAPHWPQFAAAVFPQGYTPKDWALDTAHYLHCRNYGVKEVRRVIEHIDGWGTVEECLELAFDATDRAIVESFIPLSQGWDHPDYGDRVGLAGDRIAF